MGQKLVPLEDMKRRMTQMRQANELQNKKPMNLRFKVLEAFPDDMSIKENFTSRTLEFDDGIQFRPAKARGTFVFDTTSAPKEEVK